MMYITDPMSRSSLPPEKPALSHVSAAPGDSPSTRVGSAALAGEAESTGEYTIDELSALARVPSRTIRFYQSKGALSSPEIRGRVAFYGNAHVERLKLIAQLQDRGLRIDAIRGLVKSIDRGELDMAEWLGVEQQLQASWAHDHARTVTESELITLAGSSRPGLIADLTRIKLVERRGDVYIVESPALLAIAMKLEAVGIDHETAAEAAEIVKKHLGKAVSELTQFFLKRARDGFVETAQPAKLFEALRPMGIEAVRIIFGKQMEAALRKLLESGALTSLPASRTKRRR
ncbi:MAG: putative transcription regulator protein [Myxococcaceae bacterium]|nr:putative transcription regulator protein [Myxococcaceae bacterium]